MTNYVFRVILKSDDLSVTPRTGHIVAGDAVSAIAIAAKKRDEVQGMTQSNYPREIVSCERLGEVWE